MGVKKNRTAGRAAPRYKVDTEDTLTIRFTSSKNKKISTTRIVDISETGVSFTTARKMVPKIGEMIKMDFHLPGGHMQIACMGRVVRMEEPTPGVTWAKFPDTVRVGVEFFKLPHTYRNLLSETLQEIFKAQDRPYKEEPIVIKSNTNYEMVTTDTLITIGKNILVITVLALIVYFTYSYITENPKKPESPSWSKGFFEKAIPK